MIYKNKLKWIKDLIIRPDTINLLEENISRTLFHITHSNILFGPPPRIMIIKIQINQRDLRKLKSFCTAKEIIKKRQPTEWEKIFVNKATDKGLIAKIYKQVLQLNSKKKQTTQLKNGQKT